MTWPCFKRVNTTSRLPLLDPCGKPNPVTVVILKSFSHVLGLQHQQCKISELSFFTEEKNFMNAVITALAANGHA